MDAPRGVCVCVHWQGTHLFYSDSPCFTDYKHLSLPTKMQVFMCAFV